METMNKLVMVRHLAARLSLLLRVYAMRMAEADRCFHLFLRSASEEEREIAWNEYLKQSSKAATHYARHHRLALRIIRGA